MERIPLTQAKARLSGLVQRLIHRKGMITITNRGRNVAVLMAWEEYERLSGRNKGSLLEAVGALGDLDRELDEMVRLIYDERRREKPRNPPF